MQSRIIVSTQEESLLSTHKVLRNTYFLLALTLAFSAVVAYVSMAMNLPRPGLILMLVSFYGLLFLTNALANSALGILSAFAFTGFLGYTVGPILNAYVSAGLGDAIVLALAGTAATFFACSAYVLTTKKDMSFLSGTILALFVVLLLGMIASFFFQFPALYVSISALFVVFSTMGILYETSNIIHGGETNYIRATVSLFVSIYNLFISLLNLLSFFSSRD
ncbi:Bax inhibitor-1 family protein [Aggregatibacter actinomycetemcomitans]|uniref:Bax inhibitor-1 family protein n=1 Tax=Aggregatibacter actinomycetemcomitans TaxID=714 RepID=UPI00022AD853|nr:Bax inhibitor-1 family protein [Aggregatibacter actinomycetemcomitans]KOE63532.1 membrane protein [Aggregatibacter actinomycetemcomitans serotype e str. A160]KOE66206.1 membrane protein [Aggregatibacter actinomycetemcomitans serotype e str. SCC393]KOE70710.1 membrane protein [Aggregatibacter actinomycetemcomitans serotype f str. D18P1]KYK73294.1 HflBKC-binding inner membrane protein [Aggregatibacter actinomycetemcomitans serotype e str. SA2876]KYK89129.1 HflBKC-binding inner membrane protei